MLMKFSFDPELIAKARQIILHRPNLNVLSVEREAEYSPLVRSMEAEFKKRHAAGKLLLPDLSALANQTVGIFSDYSGESTGNYDTYSFLICGWGSLDPFRQQMRQVREKFAMGSKEIGFKDFAKGPIQRALPSYLETLNGYVPGLLFTLVIDKRLVSLFGARHRSTTKALAGILEERGFGARKPLVAEKVMRVIHTAAYLTALLGHEGQKIFWMTVRDSICPTPEMHNRMLELFHNVLSLYTSKKFGLIGGARQFAERSTDYLDLLSATDIAAGVLAQYFTERDKAGDNNVCIKPGAEKVLQWLGLDAWALKKMCVMISAGDNGAILSGTVECTPTQMPEEATFLPTQLCR
jgi:hypothetical protein